MVSAAQPGMTILNSGIFTATSLLECVTKNE